ncbi:MAG: CidA/LrgA family protein [Janthinobacterium lividum]
MRRTAEFLASLALFALLSTAGLLAAARLHLPLPGPIIGLLVYSLLLSLGYLGWTLSAARVLSGLLGAMIVPALVGVALYADVTARGGWRLAVALVAGTAVTGVATALLFRVAGGRA